MSGLMWYLIEAAVAVALLGGIVWLTWPRRDDDDDRDRDQDLHQREAGMMGPGCASVLACGYSCHGFWVFGFEIIPLQQRNKGDMACLLGHGKQKIKRFINRADFCGRSEFQVIMPLRRAACGAGYWNFQ